MARNKQTSNGQQAASRAALLNERLKLIKKRHWELIVRPREQLLGSPGDPEEEEAFHSLDEAEDLQLLEDYSYGSDF
jgi:hypothetical protein